MTGTADTDIVDLRGSGADGTGDRLASIPGIRTAASPEVQQFVLDGFLETEVCKALIERIDYCVRPSTIPTATTPSAPAAPATSITAIHSRAPSRRGSAS